jgi:phosphatidylethanolamine N-methyltransferase
LHPAVKVLGGALFAAGNVFVLSSMWALGVTGTYLGDYFGILMEEMVTGFPFNVMSDPMYWGSSMCFVGVSLWCVDDKERRGEWRKHY